jgi:release factor glutamine methyltransferase
LRREVVARLRAAGVDTPALDANVLIGHVLGIGPEQVVLRNDSELAQSDLREVKTVTRRRERREPVAYITGTKAFRRLEISVNRDVLIPRPETEVLVEVGLALWDVHPGAPAVDIGTGSGAIALALADERPERCVVACDCSSAALRVAAGNARCHQLSNRVRLCLTDGAAGLDLRGAIVLANLPYIPSTEMDALQPEISRWEPRLAVIAGSDGLSVIRKVVAQTGRGGARAVAFEIGVGQAETVAALLCREGFEQTAVHRDLAGHPRVVTGTRVS